MSSGPTNLLSTRKNSEFDVVIVCILQQPGVLATECLGEEGGDVVTEKGEMKGRGGTGFWRSRFEIRPVSDAVVFGVIEIQLVHGCVRGVEKISRYGP